MLISHSALCMLYLIFFIHWLTNFLFAPGPPVWLRRIFNGMLSDFYLWKNFFSSSFWTGKGAEGPRTPPFIKRVVTFYREDLKGKGKYNLVHNSCKKDLTKVCKKRNQGLHFSPSPLVPDNVKTQRPSLAPGTKPLCLRKACTALWRKRGLHWRRLKTHKCNKCVGMWCGRHLGPRLHHP
jgi:hypothetical protein